MPKRYGVKASVRVVIHPNLKALRGAHSPISGKDARYVMAFCHLWPRDEKKHNRRMSILADLHFAIKHTCLDTIVHEVTHAAISWIGKDKQRWVTLIDDSDIEVQERLCDLIGGLTQGIVAALQKRGIEVYA